MGQPPTYTRQYNFNDFATTSPSTPLPGDKVDAELNAAKLTLDELNANIAKIQRDDGKLGNTVVHKDAFDAGALALMSTGSMTPRGSWSAGVSYVVSDLADFNNATYLATAAHTSASAFTTDLAASRWILLANAAISGTANSVDKFSGTGSQTAFTLTSSYASNTSVLVFVNGALRNPGDDYSISGTTLTFVTAPSVPSVSGNENVIAWGPSVVAQAASDAALASSSNASGFADEAQSWASKVNGIVESTDYSSKAYAVGGTGVDAGSGSAKDWATKTGGTVGNTSEYSAKYWATSSNVATVVGAVSAINTVSGSITNVNNVGGSISNVNSLAAALGTATVFAVTVASVGGSNKFHLDGVTAPTLSLFRGNTYTFDLSNSSNSGHPLAFKDGSGNSYTTGVVTSGTPGSSGATVTFTVASDAPSSLSYYCTVHGAGMGNTISVSSSNLSTVASNIADVNTTATNIAAVNTVAGVASTMSAAATNATNAAASASAAANSAAAAAASFDTFDDRYLGSKSSEPSVDNDGNALVSGALFFDSAVGSMKVFDGGNWILATSAGAVSLLDYEYTATAGQTTFTGSDNNSATLSYSAGNLIVTLNGIVLDNGSDYTATSGTSIVLASGAALNDHLAVVAFKSFTVADTVAASTGGTFAGGVTVSGTLTATAAQVNGKVQATDDMRLVAATSTTRRLNSFVANNTYNLGLSGGAAIAFHRTSDTSDEIGFETHKHGNSHAERFRIGSLGQFGIGGANYGTSGQILTSGGSGASPSWADLNAGFLTNVINVTTSGETVLTASQSGSLLNVTNSGAIIKLPTAAAGIYFGIINLTPTPIVVRATGSGVFGNGVLMPVPLSKATGLGLYVGIDSTHWGLNYDTSSANAVHRFNNASPTTTNNYSATFTTSPAATKLLLILHSGLNNAGYGSGGVGYSNSPQGGIGYGEKLITGSLPSTLTIAGDYLPNTSASNNPNSASRLTVTGTGVNIYTQRGTGGHYQTYSGAGDFTGGTVVGCDFAAAGGQGRSNSSTGYNNSSGIAIGGAGAGSPAGTGGRPASSNGTISTFKLNNGNQFVGQPSGIGARHAGGSGGNDGTATAGGASATRDSNSISMIPYVGKEFYCPAGGINTRPTAEGYDSGLLISDMNTQKGPKGSNFGKTPSDLIYLFGAGNHPLFSGTDTAAHGGGPWGNLSATYAQCVIIELKG